MITGQRTDLRFHHLVAPAEHLERPDRTAAPRALHVVERARRLHAPS